MPNATERDSGYRDAKPVLQVLVVDDNPLNREACSALLSLWGIEPVSACDGSEALRLVRERSFDLVLMDISMPVMDGLTATEEIRRFEEENAERASVPVVAYSSDDVDPEVLHRARLSGALRKPTDAMTMAECLHRWCGEKFSST